MSLIILRCVFIICAGGASAIINSSLSNGAASHDPYLVFLTMMGIAAAVVVADIYVPRKRIDTISAVYFGLVVGTLLTYILEIGRAHV